MSKVQVFEPSARVETMPEAPPRRAAFSPEEAAELRAEDRFTAAVIAGVLCGILTIGLILYTSIFIWVYSATP